MAIWKKLFSKITFKDYPDTSTPLNANNLNKMTDAIDGIDDRVVELNSNLTEITSELELDYIYVKLTHNNGGLDMHLRKYGKVVHCYIAGVMTPSAKNTKCYFNDGEQTIPDGFKPLDIAVVSVNLVVASEVSGSARVFLNPDGIISFETNADITREYIFSTTWITND